MFGYGLESLLNKQTNFKVVGKVTDVEQAVKIAATINPHVIVLDDTDPVTSAGPILESMPQVKVISLNLRSNRLQIYWASQRIAQTVEDLVTAIGEQHVRKTQQNNPWPGNERKVAAIDPNQ